MLFKFVAVGLAYTAAFAAAYTAPATKGSPSGNDIFTPGLEEAVPAGKPYTITWKPTTPGPITLVFLKGPASNAIAQYAIAEHIDNSGSYQWTPSASLAPGKTGYGILLVDESTGAYQYSTQFGISNSDNSGSTGGATATQAGPTTTASSAVTKTSIDSYATTTKAAKPTTTASDDDEEDSETTTTTTSSTPATTSSASLTTPSAGTTTVVPVTQAAVSGNSTAPTGMRTTTSSAPATRTTNPVVATGAAATMASSFAGLVFAAGVAVLAL
jgi:hypothetical protein